MDLPDASCRQKSPRSPYQGRNVSRILAFLSLFLSLLLFSFWVWGVGVPISSEILSQSTGQIFTDVNGQTVYFNTSPSGEYLFEAVDFSDMPLFFVEAVLALEDDNYFAHGAIDAPAVFRAFVQNIFAGEVVSGASTITLQLSKKLLNNTQRTLANKIREAVLAFRLEKQFSKEEIFGMWANRAPFGGNIVGLSAASELYFRKKPKNLSLAQSAYLASIPKNPARYSPQKNNNLLKKRKEYALLKMYQHGFISSQQFQSALQEEILPFSNPPQLQAPHLIMYLKDLLADSPSIQLSIDLGLQKKIEGIVSRYLSLLSGNRVKNAAVIVVENKTGAIRAYMGNADYSAKDDSGEVDVLRSFRQAGSTLKPFVYYLAFRDLGWNSETVILDEPIGFDSSLGTTFAPKNFDLDYRGEITVRQALAESRNIPAVSTLAKVGEKKFKDFLESLGVEFLLPQDDSGLSAVLGASEIRLIDLAKLYVLLARQGQNFFFCFVGVCPEQQGGQLLDRNLVLEITDILADNTARIEAFGEDSALSFNFPVAAKTGTSRNFRDNYTIGFTSEYTVLVWIGNADGSPMREVSGITGAGPIFQDTMLLLADNSNPKVFPEAERREGDSGNFSSLRILQPLQNAEFAIDSSRPLEDQKILFETNIEADFYVDGQQIGFGAKVFWIPKTGRHELLVKNGEGEQRVRFIVR